MKWTTPATAFSLKGIPCPAKATVGVSAHGRSLVFRLDPHHMRQKPPIPLQRFCSRSALAFIPFVGKCWENRRRAT